MLRLMSAQSQDLERDVCTAPNSTTGDPWDSNDGEQ
jgi:hypothetical protein